MVSPKAQQKLIQVFHDKMQLNQTNETRGEKARHEKLTAIHLQELLTNYNLTHESKTIQAQFLYCLSMLFMRLSSVHGLGTDSESPMVLRLYALALLNTAYEVDPTIIQKIPTHYQKHTGEKIVNSLEFMQLIQDRVLGLNDEFDFADTVYAMLLNVLDNQKNKQFELLFEQLIPVAWK